MKPISFILTTLLPLSTAQLVVQQHQLGHLPIMPPTDSNKPSILDDNTPHIQPAVPLSDILGTHRSLTTFSSLTRQSSSISALLSSPSKNTTALAPLNSAIEALPRKLWEDPRDAAAEMGEDRANANLKRFVEAHLVGASPWGEGERKETIGGRTLWWEVKEDGRRVVMPDGVEVDKVASRVGNGEVWILRGVLNYA